MSIVTAVKKDDMISIAADSVTTSDGLKLSPGNILVNNHKIISVGGSYVGIVGSAAGKDVLLSAFKGIKHNFSDKHNIFKTMLKLHSVLKDKYFIETRTDDFQSFE